MAIKKYQESGNDFWMAYVNIRSRTDSSIRVQRRALLLKSSTQALAEEKKLLREATEELARREGYGLTWESVVGQWELAMRDQPTFYRYNPITIADYVAAMHRWTAIWLKKPADQLNRGDAREVLNALEAAGKSRSFILNVKSTVNVIFDWAIEQRIVRNVSQSPMRGLQFGSHDVEKVPDILTLDEIRKLLFEAKQLEHAWYPIWAMALLTGMRNGELHALLWSDVDFENRRITVSKSYNTKMRTVKSTKAGTWRSVPISDELLKLLLELKASTGTRKEVLPRSYSWNMGVQADILRGFCRGIGIRPVKFHALRACFATQLLASDIAPARVMKICGWKDLKTMQYYIRLAGVDERGATQVLKIMPSDAAVMGEVVNLFDFKAKSER